MRLPAGVAALLCAVAFGAEAGISLSPVRVDLSDDRRADAITVHNTDVAPREVEVEVLRWTQADGEDVYQPATELRANPSHFTVAGGAAQIVRVGLVRGAGAPDAVESAYRIYFRELPRAQDGDAGNALQFALRIGVPLFVRPRQPAEPQLAWSIERQDDRLQLTAVNHGRSHARVADVKLRDDVGETPVDGFRYVLPGATRTWTLPNYLGQPQALTALLESGRGEFLLPTAR